MGPLNPDLTALERTPTGLTQAQTDHFNDLALLHDLGILDDAQHRFNVKLKTSIRKTMLTGWTLRMDVPETEHQVIGTPDVTIEIRTQWLGCDEYVIRPNAQTT